mgnify:CR=1 FL=1
MEFNLSTVAAIVALFVSVSATYNAYILRGGKLAWSQVLVAFGTVCLMFSVVLDKSGYFKFVTMENTLLAKSSDILAISGFIFLFLGRWKLRT